MPNDPDVKIDPDNNERINVINFDRKLMEYAVELAENCRPDDTARTPRLGVVIAVGGQILSAAFRGTGSQDDDDHAELVALERVFTPSLLSEATVYTTLEPCTHHVRRNSGTSCSERLGRMHVKKVFIGILDPNEGVCGKGVIELQKRGIEVAFFDDDLVRKIQKQNEKFILAQQSLGVEIVEPIPNEIIELRKQPWGGWHRTYHVVCNFINEPGTDVCLIVQSGGNFWPQGGVFSRSSDKPGSWEAEVSFGAGGTQTIFVARANELGLALINYYRDIITRNNERTKLLRERIKDLGNKLNLEDISLPKEKIEGLKLEEALLKELPGNYQGIRMSRLPKGIDPQEHVQVIVKRPDDAS